MSERLILVLADGEWSSTDRAADLARQAMLVIAADGAWARARAAGIEVDLVIGDLDSLTQAERTALEASGVDVRAFPPDKDQTDLELALDDALTWRPSSIALYGAMGLRLDHAQANLHLLERALDVGIPIRLLHGTETAWVAAEGEEPVDGCIGDRVSLLPISESAIVSTQGLRFPLRRERLRRSETRGVSNRIDGLPAMIQVHEGRILVIHAPGA